MDAAEEPRRGPCGHPLALVDTTDGEKLPIAVAATRSTSAMLWCARCGWVDLTPEEMEGLGRHA